MDTYHAEVAAQSFEVVLGKDFVRISDVYYLVFNLIRNKVPINLDVFCAIVMAMISCNAQCCLVVTIDLYGLFNFKIQLCKDPLSQIPSQIPSVSDLNSASALLLKTTDCFLLLHVTTFPQTYEQYPKFDILSVMAPAQSASV